MTASGPQFLKGSLDVAANGETIGEKDEPVAQGPQGEESQSQEGAQGEAPQSESQDATNSVKSELVAFSKFVKARSKSGKWRDFEFVYASPDEAERLNAEGRLKVAGADPKWERL